MPDDAAASGGETDAPADVVYLRPTQRPGQVERIALVAGLTAGAVLAGLVGWLSFRTYEAQNREAQRNLFVQTAEELAVNPGRRSRPASRSFPARQPGSTL